jgi:hypothetical protein
MNKQAPWISAYDAAINAFAECDCAASNDCGRWPWCEIAHELSGLGGVEFGPDGLPVVRAEISPREFSRAFFLYPSAIRHGDASTPTVDRLP